MTLPHSLITVITVIALLLNTQTAVAEERFTVRESYVNIYSGPGRGYPIFDIAERREWIEIIQIRTDWFKVRSQNGKVGWAYKEDLQLSLSPSGEPISFEQYILQNYQNQRFEFGFSGGNLASRSALGARFAYRLNPFFSAELGWLKASDAISTSTAYNLNLLLHPFTLGRLSPYFTLGVGQFNTVPDSSIENALASDSDAFNVGTGMYYYLSSRFLLRLDYRNYFVYLSDEEIGSHQEWTVGFSFFYGSHAETLFEKMFATSPNTLDFEIGLFIGSYSMQDLSANTSQGLRLAYFITEDFFVEGNLASSKLVDRGFESSGFNLFSDDDQMRYYSLLMGYNALPGEIVFRGKFDWATQLYFVAGVGNTEIKNEDYFTVTVGAGLRISPTDNFAIHWDVRNHIFNSDLFGEEITTNNFEIHYGLSYIF